MRVFSRQFACVVLLLVLLVSVNVQGAPGDDQLILDLEAATARQNRNEAVRAIYDRAATGPMSDPHIEEIIRLTITRKELLTWSSGILITAATLHRPLSEQSLVYLAQALRVGVNSKARRAIIDTLQSIPPPLPEPVYAALLGENDEMPIIDLLAAMPAEDPRFAGTVAVLQSVMESDAGRMQRSTAISGLARMNVAAPLPHSMIGALAGVILTDESLYIRVEALELLAMFPVDDSMAKKVTESLARDFSGRSAVDWNPGHHQDLGTLALRATAVLIQLFERPYPSQVGDVMVITLRGHEAVQAGAELISNYVQYQQLTDEQFQNIVGSLRNERYAPRRDAILGIQIPQLSAELVEEFVYYFASTENDSIRILSAFRLLYHYREAGVPTEIADVAAEYVLNRATPGMLPVSLLLLSNAAEKTDTYEQKVLSAIAIHKDQLDVYRRLIQYFSGKNVDSLVLGYAGDVSMPARLRSYVIDMLAADVNEGRALSPEVEKLLLQITRQSKDNVIIQTAGRILEANGTSTPVRVTLKSRDFQSTLLFVVFGAMFLLNSAALIVGSVTRSTIRAVGINDSFTAARRTGSLATWILASVVVAILLAVAFVGFIGHTSAPKPGYTLIWNVPAYVATIFYLAVAYSSWRKYRTSEALHAATKKNSA